MGQQEYSITATNALAAEACLQDLISVASNLTTNKLISTRSLRLAAMLSKIDGFGEYSNIYWPVHCQLAGDERTSGRRNYVFRLFVSGESGTACPIELWSARLPYFLEKCYMDIELRRRLDDTLVMPTSAPASAVQRTEAGRLLQRRAALHRTTAAGLGNAAQVGPVVIAGGPAHLHQVAAR